MVRKLIGTIFLAPLGWLLIAPFWAKRFLGFLPGLSFLTVKYTITNRRLMIRKGMKAVATTEIPLDQIGEVRIRTDGNSDFYVTADLQVLRKEGSVAFEMPGVPEPEPRADRGFGPSHRRGVHGERRAPLSPSLFAPAACEPSSKVT